MPEKHNSTQLPNYTSITSLAAVKERLVFVRHSDTFQRNQAGDPTQIPETSLPTLASQTLSASFTMVLSVGQVCLDKMPSLVDSGLTYDGSGFTTDWSRRFRNRAVTEQVLM